VFNVIFQQSFSSIPPQPDTLYCTVVLFSEIKPPANKSNYSIYSMYSRILQPETTHSLPQLVYFCLWHGT